jgi:hypothetical protein
MTKLREWVSVCEIVLDDEDCTVIYPPLGWPNGTKVYLTIIDEPIPYTVTDAGRKAVGGGA